MGVEMRKGQTETQILSGNLVEDLLADLKDALLQLYGSRLHQLLLYGSYARGTARPGSDIDVAVILDEILRPWPEIDRTGPLVAQLSLKYGVTISLMPVRKADWEGNRTMLARGLHREGIAVG